MFLSRHHATRAMVLAIAFVAALSPVAAHAAPGGSVQRQADEAKSRLGTMQQQLTSAMSEYDTAERALTRTRAEIAANRLRLEALDASMKLGQARLSAEVNFLYRTDGNGFTEALLSAPSIDAFASRLVALSRIANRDAELIRTIRRDRAAAGRVATQLAQREAKQEALVREVASRRAKARAAIEDQQRYADSLSPKVAAKLDEGSTAKGPHAPTRRPTNPSSLAWAKVEGRSGRYAVLATQRRAYAPTGITFTGVATWYGNVRPNMKTASGRAFNENELTCAHKTLPFGTRVAVTFRGKRVIVTVTDRGPYGKGRVIDLTKRAAAIIGLKRAGVGKVRCEVVRAQ